MGGRKSNLEAWFAWAQTLPWWIAFGLAAGLWAGLHVLALGWSLAPSGLPAPIGTIPVRLIVGFVARMLQYLLPAVFVVGGLAGLVLKARRSRVYALASADPVQLVHGMSWRDFERLVADAFTRQGYQVQERGGDQPDGGVDLVVVRDRKRYYVQCKQWKTKNVDVATVRELMGTMAAAGVDGGFVVSAAGFTRDAWAFAKDQPVQLIDQERLSAMMRSDALSPAAAATQGLRDTANSRSTGPSCPRCHAGMTRRVARSGRHAGKSFWGCRKYPQCRGTRGIA